MDKILRTFNFPSNEELVRMSRAERINIFRRYFATSRYNRLLIQQTMIRSVLDNSNYTRVKELEEEHKINFFDTTNLITTHGLKEEFIFALEEEFNSLEKILQAYNNKLNPS